MDKSCSEKNNMDSGNLENTVVIIPLQLMLEVGEGW